MSPTAINHLNTGLILASGALAFALPFQAFLFAYAVLGPLHYLTQISWLHDRGYFTRRKTDALVLLGLTVFPVAIALMFPNPVEAVRRSAPFVCLAFVAAGVMAFTPSWTARVVVPGVVALALAVVPHPPAVYVLFFGLFLTTLVHVFVFTALFMLVGAVRSRSASGFLSVVALVVTALACLALRPDAAGAQPSAYVRGAYLPFYLVNVQLATALGWEPLRTVDDLFRSPAGVAAMRFIAFAYTYHYLNWFSKTKVIGWHEISRGRALAIVAAWVVAVSLYLIDYRIGLLTLSGLSLLHVLLEFPLNHTIVADLGRHVAAPFRSARPARAAR